VRAVLVIVAVAGCGRFGFNAGRASDAPEPGDGPFRDGPIADTSAGDGRPADAAIDAFDQAAACTGFAICDSFESPAFSNTWTATAGVTLDSTHVHRGTQAVHVHNPARASGTGSYNQLGETATFSGASVPTTFYVRGWFYMTSLPAGTNHLEIISLEAAMSSSLGDYTFVYSDDTALYTDSDMHVNQVGMAPPLNTWFCIVMRITRGTSSNGSLGLTSDVLPATMLPSSTTEATVNPLHSVALGLGMSGTNTDVAQPAMDMWVDDVIVDPNPPTCAD
jgi:hypothetical protein